MSSAPVRYFAPTYYTPYYFPSLVAAGDGVQPDPNPPAPNPPVPNPPTLAYRDRDAFAAIVAALTATGEFADVSFGTTLDRRAAGADLAPAAVINPEGWDEGDDADPVVLVRRVSYTLTLVVRDEDPAARYDALDRLTSVAQNAIDGRNLGGCLPSLTLLRKGRFDPDSRHPEQGVIIHGEFARLIPSLTGHDPSH